MTSWLSKQKKQALLELSAEAGLKQDDDVRKDDLIDNLDKYLQANSSRLARNTSFQPYFDTRRTPFKARSSSAGGVTSDDGEVKSVVKARGRRTTKVKPEVDDEDAANLSPSGAVAAASNAISNALTPAVNKVRRRSQLLPASPADVADDVEDATKKFYSSLSSVWNDTRIPEIADTIREHCSSGLAVQATALALEAYGLQNTVLPRRYAFDVPSVRLGRTSTPSYAITLPDLFQLVTGGFWYNTLLWSSTSIFIPLLFSYFYNISTRDARRPRTRSITAAGHGFDPLIFNVAKALLTYIIYGQNYNFGIIDRRAISAVSMSMVGGYQGMMIGSYVGILVALYEAVLNK